MRSVAGRAALRQWTHYAGRRYAASAGATEAAGAASSAADVASAKVFVERLRTDAAFQAAIGQQLEGKDVAAVRRLHAIECGHPPEPLSRQQIWRLAIRCAVPFFGFGICDNLIMISVGDAIDSAFGVTLGFSTMIAAGLGQAVSDGSGITIQGFIENAADRLGLPDPGLSEAQKGESRTLWLIQIFRTIGIVLGCLFGLIPVIIFDTGNRPRISDQLLRCLPEETRKELSGKATIVEFQPGEALMRYGEEVPAIFTLVTGECHVVGRNDYGEPVTLATHVPGDSAGVVEVVYGHRCVADVVAASPVRAIRISREDFRAASIGMDRIRNVVNDFIKTEDNYVTYRLRYFHGNHVDTRQVDYNTNNIKLGRKPPASESEDEKSESH